MFVSSWLRQLQRRWFGRRAIRRAPVRRVQPCLEVLEDRTVPTTFDNVGDVATLIADITAANSSSDPSNTINLVAGTTFDLTTIDNYWYGPNGLPAISSTIVINGNGATIERDSSAPDFRLFYVSGGLSGLPAGNLTLEDLTLEGGVAKGGNSNVGGAGLGAGGAIFNQGILALNGVTLTDNTALGGSADGTNSGGGGGGGMGEDAPDNSNGGGGFGNNFSGFGGAGGAGNGGGGGFNAAGGNAAGTNGGAGGGLSGLGGNGGNSGSSTGGTGGDGGGGAAVGALGGGNGGNFGNGGGDGGGGGGGGVGGGGARGGGGGFGGGGGGDNGGTVTAGAGGFGGGGGGGGGVTSGNIGGFAGGDGSNGTGGGGGGLGGALFNMYGVVSLTNCTLADNTAQGGNALRGGSGGLGGSGYGGAIFNLDGTLNLTFCTVADNTVAAGTGDSGNGQADGGAIYNLAYGHTPSGTPVTASLTLTDSILADSNGGPHDLVNDQDTRTGFTNGSAVVTATAPNIVTSSTALNGSSINGTFLTANPQLGPLQNNGGPTSTMALLPGSLAIVAGVPVAGVTTDQRGLLRPDNPSLGAFEAQPLPPAPPSPPAPPATASIQFTSITVVPNLLALNQTETINVHVSGSSGGTVAFTVDGQSVSTSVDDNGNATVSLTLPLLTAAFPQSINAVYNGADAAGSATQTAYWWLVDALLPALDTFAADGGQAVQSYFLGLPLLDFLYTAQGRLTEVIFGPDLLSWTYSYTEVLTVVTLDGVLPVLVSARTPQGQFLGAVALTVSTDGTLVVETINAQGQVVSSQPL